MTDPDWAPLSSCNSFFEERVFPKGRQWLRLRPVGFTPWKEGETREEGGRLLFKYEYEEEEKGKRAPHYIFLQQKAQSKDCTLPLTFDFWDYICILTCYRIE